MGQQSSVPAGEPGAEQRALARREFELKKDMIRTSQESWDFGRRDKAKEYSLASQAHASQAALHNSLAAHEIFLYHNKSYLYPPAPPTTSTPSYSYYSSFIPTFAFSLFTSSPKKTLEEIDLHGLFISEALPLVERHLELCKKHNVKRTLVITGRGLHSEGGVAKIKPEVERMLRSHKVRVVTPKGRRNEGAILVEFLEDGVGWGGWIFGKLFGTGQ